MSFFEILKIVDEGADFYLRIMGQAAHMKIVDNGIYEYMRSISDINNLSSVYNVRLDHLSDDEMLKAIAEIKAKNTHTWFPLAASERVCDYLYGKNIRKKYTINDLEIYGVMLTDNTPKISNIAEDLDILEIRTMNEFERWCDIDNNIEHNGTIIFYPKNHFHLIKSGKMRCFLGCIGEKAVATCAILDNDGVCSLEFVSVLPEFRLKGYAKKMCVHALQSAFVKKIQSVSVRAIGDGCTLGKSLGFEFVDMR